MIFAEFEMLSTYVTLVLQIPNVRFGGLGTSFKPTPKPIGGHKGNLETLEVQVDLFVEGVFFLKRSLGRVP